jgi:predicted MFS family arabinose efflux permease
MAKTCPTPQPLRTVVGAVILMSLLFLVTFLSLFIFSPLLPAIIRDNPSITASQGGSLFLAGAFGVLLGSLTAGLVSSRVKHRGAIIISLSGIAASLVGAYFAGSVWALRAVLIALGICAGLHLPSSVATITAMVRREEWGRALSIQQLAPPLSLVAGPLIAVLLLRWFAWNAALLWIAGLSALMALIFMLFTGGVGAFPGEPPARAYLGPVLRTPSFYLMVFLFALGMGTQVGVYTMLPLYMTTERGMSSDAANTLIGLANLAPLAFVFMSGWMTSRLGEKRTMASFPLLSPPSPG